MGENHATEIKFLAGLISADADSIVNATTGQGKFGKVKARVDLLLAAISMSLNIERLLALLK